MTKMYNLKQIMLPSPFKPQNPQPRKHSSSTRSKTQDKARAKRTMSTIQSTTLPTNQSLPKLSLNKNLLPLQKSLLFLGWNSTKNKNILPVIEEKRFTTIEPKRNMRMFRKYRTDQQGDNSETSSQEYKTIEPPRYSMTKPLVRSLTKEFEETGERVLNEDSIKVKLNQPISKTTTLDKGGISEAEKIPLQFIDKLIEDKEGKRSISKHQPKLKSMKVELKPSDFYDGAQNQIRQQKTIFDEFRNRERIYLNSNSNPSSSESKQKIDQQYLPKIKIQNRQLTKIPLKEEITKFIESYNSLEDGWRIPVDDPEFIVIWGKKDLYIGQSRLVNGGKVRDGKGILLTEHSHFEGEFENNQKKSGYELRTNGIYKGEFQHNKRGGKGEFIWFNGQYYNGEWLDNQKHGSGIWTSSYTQANPDTYIGEWKHGKVDGYGVHTWKNRSNKYEGEFLDYLKHGKGLERFQNGDKYEGEYRNGKPEGYGEYFWADGSYYKGNFYNGLREMEGVYCEPNGNRYEGEYKNDCKHGMGKIYYIDGSVFKGMFVANKKQGEGSLKTKKGEVIKGYWRNGKLIQMF